MIEEARTFAGQAHEGQFRKGTNRPYIVHPLEVAEIVQSLTSDEEVICAALLHDTVEDCEMVTEEIIRARFGERVAYLVLQESEDKSKTWRERKSTTIQRLKTAQREVQMIGLADKLANMRDIDRDYPETGEELWNRFRMKDRDVIGWYYRGVLKSLEKAFSGTAAYEEYRGLVEKYFGSQEEKE